MTHVILSAEEDRQDTDRPARFVDVEPVDRPSDGQMPQAGQDVVMTLAAMGSGRNSPGGLANLQHPGLGVIESALQALAESEVTSQEVIEYQPEVASGLGRELKMERHAHGAWR